MNERGFTLAELLVVSAVLGIIMLGILGIQRAGLSAYQTGAARVEVQQNARAGLDTMLNEVRSATAITMVPGTCDLPAGATSISITDQGGTAVQYQLVGSDLQRNGVTLVGGVESLRIWCYDANEDPTDVAMNVRTVHVQIGTRTESGVSSSSERNQHALMESRVRLRNF